MAKVPATKSAGGSLVHAQAFQDELAALKKQLTAPSGDFIRLKGKKFRFPSDTDKDPGYDELDVVIVDFVYYNAYYETAFRDDTPASPVCFALSPEPTGMIPSPNCPDKQCDACTGCEMNEFGPNNEAKPCQNRVLIAVLPRDANEDTPFNIISISPTSNKKKDPTGFQNYIKSVASSLRRPPYGVVTNLTFDPQVAYPKVMFDHAQEIVMDDDGVEFVNMVRSRREEARARLMTEPRVAANDAQGPKKTALKAPVRRRA